MISSCSYNMKIASGHFRLLVRILAISIVARQFQNCPDSFNTVRTVSILSGRLQPVRTASILSRRFQYCPDVFISVRTASILSGRFQNCPDDFNTVRKGLLSTLLYDARGDLRSFSYVATGDIRIFLYVARSVFTRIVRTVFARKKLLSGKF